MRYTAKEQEAMRVNEAPLSDLPMFKVEHGTNGMTDSELLSIILLSGNKQIEAIELARKILLDNENDLRRVLSLTVNEWTRYHKIGIVTARRIVATIELMRRMLTIDLQYKEQLCTSRDVYKVLKRSMSQLDHEEVHLVMLTNQNKLIKVKRLFVGGVSETTLDPFIVFKTLLKEGCHVFAIAHNHPSGEPIPSGPDTTITKKIKSGSENLGMRMLDHIIFCEDRYYSFADEGKL